MSATASTGNRSPLGVRSIIAIAAIVILIVAMALDTTVIKTGSNPGANPDAFSKNAYGESEFPKVQKAIAKKAVSADKLAAAIKKDQSAAEKKYGVAGTIGAEMSVKFTGVVGKSQGSGIFPVKVKGLPDDLEIRMQTGPAINGTDIRDATGNIKFGDFTNQIQYQDAGAALNNEMKKEVLSKIDTDNLKGKTVQVVGVFNLINPNNWLVTPVKLSVQ